MKSTNAVYVCIEELGYGWLKVTSRDIPKLLVYFGSGEAKLAKKLPEIISSFMERESTKKQGRKRYREVSMRMTGIRYEAV